MSTALVTGANSGLGFHAARRLAEEGFDRIFILARTLDKAEATRAALAEQVGRDPFVAVAADMGDFEKVHEASVKVASRGVKIDYVLLNAGLMGSSSVQTAGQGVELAMAASVVGHHVLTTGLLDAGALSTNATIVISGSEAARGDMPTMNLTDVTALSKEHFGGSLSQGIDAVLRGQAPYKYDNTSHYAMVKLFVAWWAAALSRRLPAGMTVNAVSPGATAATGFAQHQPSFVRFIYGRVMMPLMGLFGRTHSLDVATARYFAPLDWPRERTGEFWASKPGAGYAVGPIEQMVHPHLNHIESQEALWQVLVAITGSTLVQPRLAMAA